MNQLVQIYLADRKRLLEVAELRKLAKDLRNEFAEIDVMRKDAEARRRAAMRQDGPVGFVMVFKP